MVGIGTKKALLHTKDYQFINLIGEYYLWQKIMLLFNPCAARTIYFFKHVNHLKSNKLLLKLIKKIVVDD